MTERFKQARGRRSQTQVSIQTGLKQTTLSGWENNPPEIFSNLADLARYYKVSTDYLLGLTDDRRPSPMQFDNSTFRALLAVVGNLTAWRQRELVFIAQGMASAQQAEAGESMDDLFGYVEDVYGVEMANRLEHVMSLLTTADASTLGRVIELLESIDEETGNAEV